MAENDLNREKSFMAISAIGAIVGFIIPLIMWAVKENTFSEYTKQFLTDILNFELVLFIISFVLCIIPVLGWLASAGLFIFNLIVVLNADSATQEQREYNFPIKVQIIK